MSRTIVIESLITGRSTQVKVEPDTNILSLLCVITYREEPLIFPFSNYYLTHDLSIPMIFSKEMLESDPTLSQLGYENVSKIQIHPLPARQILIDQK